MNQEVLRQQIKAFQPNPSEEWKRSNREFFISMVSEQYEERQNSGKVVTPTELLSGMVRETMVQKVAFRFSGVFMMLMMVLFGGYITTVGAASNAIPGDVLYPVKRAGESVRVNIAKVLDTQKAGELQLSYAFERIKEAEKVAASPAPVEKKREQVKQAVTDVQKHIQDAQHSASVLSLQGKDKEAVELATKVEQEAKTIAKVLEAKKETAIVQDEPASATIPETDAPKNTPDVKQVIEDTTAAVGQVSFDALDLIIASFVAGKTDIKEEDLRQTITKQIVDLNSRAAIPNPAGQPAVSLESQKNPESLALDDKGMQSKEEVKEKTSEPVSESSETAEVKVNPDPLVNETQTKAESADEKKIPVSETKPAVAPEVVFQIKALVDEAQKLLDEKKYQESFEKIKQADGLLNQSVKSEEAEKPAEEKSSTEATEAESKPSASDQISTPLKNP